jgi:hypothetical protein
MYTKKGRTMKPEYLDQLLNAASAAAGSDYKLAQMLETSRQSVSDWRAGRKTCPVADVALMAQIAGLVPEEWAARHIVFQHEGSAKGDKLYRALGKLLAATGAAIASNGAAGHPIFSLETVSAGVAYFTRCILC